MPVTACGDVQMHIRSRRMLHDVLAAAAGCATGSRHERFGCTDDALAGSLPGAIAIRLDAPAPGALAFTVRVEPAGRVFLQSADDLVLEEGERWSFEHLPVTGIVSTWSASNATTDSGAAATSMS